MSKINGDALRKKAQEMDVLGMIYEQVEREMKWKYMVCSSEPDESTGDYTYTPPEKDTNSDYLTDYEGYMIYQKVLKAIEKLAQ